MFFFYFQNELYIQIRVTNKSSINGTITAHQRRFNTTSVHFGTNHCVWTESGDEKFFSCVSAVSPTLSLPSCECLSDIINENIHRSCLPQSTHLHILFFFYMEPLSAHSRLRCLIIHWLFSSLYCHLEVWARWVYFSNKTEWHNERMELSWLYLIEFDQVPAQCRSNLPTAL